MSENQNKQTKKSPSASRYKMLLLNSMGFVDPDFLTLKINDKIHNLFLSF